jgi:integrase
MTGTDLVVAAPEAIAGELVISGKAAAALDRIRAGEVDDPDARRAPGANRHHQNRMTESTKRAYLRWIMQYIYFCSLFGRRDLPASDACLEHFMIWLKSLDPKKGKNAGKLGVGLAPSSMRQALAAVHSFHRASREPFPDTWLARGVIESHENDRAEPGTGLHDGEGVPPIKYPTLLELIRACPLDTNAGIRDRAMLSGGFAIMARRAELAVLDIDSIVQVDAADMRVDIARSKGKRKGRTAFLPDWPAYPECSPMRAMRAWTSRLFELGVTSGPLFRGIDQWDHIAGIGAYAGPPARSGLRMAPETVELVIARAAFAAMGEGAEIPNAAALRAHSLRAGGATSSYEAGADILSIARQGGWADNSPVIFRYIREVDMRLRNPMRLLGALAGAA